MAGIYTKSGGAVSTIRPGRCRQWRNNILEKVPAGALNQSMKAKYFFPLFAVAVLLAACVPSVNPFYTDKDVVTDARLPGVWQEVVKKDEPAVWKFEATATNAYKLTVTEEKDKTGEFSAHLFKLGGDFFLDLVPTECNYATNQAGLVGVAMIPGHLLVRVAAFAPALQLAFCNPDWLKKFLEKNPQAIAHRNEHDSIVLTAETSALQDFVRQHLAKDELFGDPGEYQRVAQTPVK